MIFQRFLLVATDGFDVDSVELDVAEVEVVAVATGLVVVEAAHVGGVEYHVFEVGVVEADAYFVHDEVGAC